jgi:formimidoylglutamate deiminase
MAHLPGFVNAHSHAVQRGLRGRGERFPAGAGSFWTWREAMYRLVEELDHDALRALTERAFREMLAAGITTVGEFHYLHHAGDGDPAGDWALDRAVIDAARATGIRLVLLQVYYRTGGIGLALEGAQRRFDGRSVDAFLARADALRSELDPARETLGIAPHSLRAASLDEIARLHSEARARDLVVHMHVAETRKEVADVRAAYGRAPLELLVERLDFGRGFTFVHGTHALPELVRAAFERGASLCLAPTTEANLGDGIPRLERVPEGQLAHGTDSNARISMLDEMRWAEYGQRLLREERGAFASPAGDVARSLLVAATAGGARALGIHAGALEPGAFADLVAIDLAAPELAGWEADTLLESLVFGAGERALAGTWVGGRRVCAR